MNSKDKEKIIQAGQIASQICEYAKSIIKKDMPLLGIAEKIENKIVELGGKPAFPTNLSINEIAAHYTPSHDDESVANGLLKVDFGVHVNGWIADTAFSVDLENSELNKKLIEASESAVSEALKKINSRSELREIGKIVEDKIHKFGFSPIINLSGHSMEKYELHSGVTIPNFDNESDFEIGEGLFAIEPFATTGGGRVKDGKQSGIYALTDTKNVRSPIAREILDFIGEEYNTLPFCSRWLVKKFGTKALLGLRQLEQNGNLHQFAQLVESSGGKVSQAEHSVLIEKNSVKVTTLG